MESPTQSRAVSAVAHPDAARREPAVGSSPSIAGKLSIAAVTTAAIGAIGVAAGSLTAVARTADGTRIPAVGGATLIAVVAALAVPAVAAALMSRWPAAAGALLAGAGAVTVGLCVLDIQLWTDPIDANRLELFRPATAAGITTGPGAALILAGHLGAVAAGALGLLTVHRASHADGHGASPDPDAVGRPAGSRIGFGLTAGVLVSAGALALALLVRPLASNDPVILVRAAIASDGATPIGAVVVAVAVLIVVAAALASTDVAVAAGAIGGAGVAALGLVGSRLAAGLVDDRLAPGPGAVWGTVGAVLLIAAAVSIPVAARHREQRAAELSVAGHRDRAVARSTPRETVGRWHTATGVAGICAGLLAGAGALLPVLTVPDPLPAPELPATRVVLVAAALIAIAAVWLLMSEFAALVRPVVGVLWVSVVAAVASVAQSALAALEIPGVGLGAGSWLMAAAALVAVVTGLLAGFAGAAERDDVDTSQRVDPVRSVVVVGVLAATAVVLAYVLPLYRGADGTAASLGRFPWGWDAWGQALSAVVVVVAVLVAVHARAARAAALLAGAAVIMACHLVAWSLSAGRLTDPVAGPGVAPAILAVALLAGTATLAGYRNPR
ncbi:hypothetical protein AB4Z09_16245 [Rhodococcus sp. TAF43]|uniref:hypothetical protein n=1 Tax=Rhodococcus sp. TAF43 TaxID=3237483 RepID=UPI003F9CF550